MVSEERIYLWTKRAFREKGWTALGGDPPRGTDLPRIEIKEPGVTHSRRKNANSIINDLVFCQRGMLALIECKDDVRKIDRDIEKLRRLLSSPDWRASLVEALRERSQFQRQGTCLDRQRILDGTALVPALAFPGAPRMTLDEFVQIAFDDDGDSTIYLGEEIRLSDASLR